MSIDEESLARTITQRISDSLSQAVESLNARSVAYNDSILESVRSLNGSMLTQNEARLAEAIKEATDQAVNSINNNAAILAANFTEGATRLTNEAATKIAEMVEELNVRSLSLTAQLDDTLLKLSKAQEALAEHEARLTQQKIDVAIERERLEAERKRCEKAVAILKIAVDTEIEANEAEINLSAKHAALVSQMKAERTQLQAFTEAKGRAIYSGVTEFVPELSEIINAQAGDDLE